MPKKIENKRIKSPDGSLYDVQVEVDDSSLNVRELSRTLIVDREFIALTIHTYLTDAMEASFKRKGRIELNSIELAEEITDKLLEHNKTLFVKP